MEQPLGTHPNTLFSNTTETSTASSKDRLKDFDAKKQGAWLEFSKTVIYELGQRASSFPKVPPEVHKDIHCPPDMLSSQVGCTYAWLADKRREIAKALKHGPLRHQFGLINKAGFMSTDDFNLSKDLPTQKNLIYAHLSDLIHQNRKNVEVKGYPDKSGEGTKYTITIKMTDEERELVHKKTRLLSFHLLKMMWFLRLLLTIMVRMTAEHPSWLIIGLPLLLRIIVISPVIFRCNLNYSTLIFKRVLIGTRTRLRI